MPLLRRVFFLFTAAVAAILVLESQAFAGEAELVLPDLGRATFFGGIDGHTLLMFGLVVCALADSLGSFFKDLALLIAQDNPDGGGPGVASRAAIRKGLKREHYR